MENTIFSLSSSPNTHPNTFFSTTHNHWWHHEPPLLAVQPLHQEERFNWSEILRIHIKGSVEKIHSILPFIVSLR